MQIAACLRIRNEELIINDTLDHLVKCGVSSAWIYNDRSTDNTLSIIKKHPLVKGIINFDNFAGNTFNIQGKQRNQIIQYAMQKSNADWIIYMDADERFYPEQDLRELLSNYLKYDGLTINLFDAYMTEDFKEPYSGGELLQLPRKFGSEIRRQLFFFRNGIPAFVPNGPFREPIGINNIGRITTQACIAHYGKGISEQQWEDTCDHYIDNGTPEMRAKWIKRKGKAIHKLSDFNTELFDIERLHLLDHNINYVYIYEYVPNYPKISLSLIAKDEQEHIGVLLDSVAPIISEVCLVDTGSTDNTINIVKEKCSNYNLPLKVKQTKWKDDYSLHRNESLELCTLDWVLIMDPDECFARRDLWKIFQLMSRGPALYQLTTFNYTNNVTNATFKLPSKEYLDMSKDYKGYGESIKGRLFPRNFNLKWHGAVHELLEHSAGTLGIPIIADKAIPIHHYGKVRDDSILETKKLRQQKLGELKVEKHPNNAHLRYELGLQYAENNMPTEAIEQFTIAINIDPTNAEALYNRAVQYLTNKEYDKALADFKNVVSLRPLHRDALNNIAVIYEIKDDLEGAKKIYLNLMKTHPDFVNSYNNYAVCLIKQEKYHEAVTYYKKALSMLETPIHVANLIMSYNKMNKWDESIALANKYTALVDSYSDVHLYIVMAALNSSNQDITLANKYIESSKSSNLLLYYYHKALIAKLSKLPEKAIECLDAIFSANKKSEIELNNQQIEVINNLKCEMQQLLSTQTQQ